MIKIYDNFVTKDVKDILPYYFNITIDWYTVDTI